MGNLDYRKTHVPNDYLPEEFTSSELFAHCFNDASTFLIRGSDASNYIPPEPQNRAQALEELRDIDLGNSTIG